MTLQARFSFSTVTSIVLIAWVPGSCLAQRDTPTIAQILEVWRARQDKVTAARIELSCEETIHKGSTSLARKYAGIANVEESNEPNPPRDYLVNGVSSVSLSGSKLRYSYSMPRWDPTGKTLYDNQCVDTFNGQLYKRLDNPASGQDDYPLANLKKATRSDSSLQLDILPLIMTFRGDHPLFFNALREFEISNRITNVATRPCIELVRVFGSSNRRDLLYLDRERGYVLVRKVILVDDLPSWQLDVTYSPNKDVGWVPRSWEYIIRLGKDTGVVQSGRRTVTSCDVCANIDDNEFDIVFPPRTLVLDESSGDEVQYVIRENGDKGIVIPTSMNPEYQHLLDSGSRPNRRVLLTIWSVVLLLTLGGWGWIWLRRRKRSRQEPQQHC